MTYRETKTATPRELIQMKLATRAAKIVNTFQCLIVSADAERRQMFEIAAAESGWKTVLCADATSAMTCIARSLAQLAIVDLENQKLETFRPVVESLTARNGLLVIVCGNEGQVDEEIWARQRGAWLYLPGVPDGNSFSTLCGEARHIAERVWKASNPQRDVPVSAATRNRYS